MIKDALINIAKGKISQIAAKTGKSESEILSAIEKGKDGSYAMARQLGLTKDVARQIYDRFGHLADRVPIVGRVLLDSEFAKVLPHLDDEPQVNRETRRTTQSANSTAKKFDKSKYFK